MKLGEQIPHENHLLGRRDAFHTPAVLCETDQVGLKAGDYVRFTGDSFTKVEKVENRESAHGIVDPFLIEAPGFDGDHLFWVLLRPGVADGVRHDFELLIDDVRKGEWSCKDCSD